MKRVLIGMLSVLAVAGTATAVKAQQDTYNAPSDTNSGATYETPNVDAQQPNMDMQRPSMDMQQPMQQPGMDMQRPNIDSQQPGVTDNFSRSTTFNEGSSYEATPFELGYLAYRGYFEEQGIASYSTFLQDLNSGKLSTQDIIAAGVESGRISPSVMEDEGYENSLRFMLQRIQVRGDS